MDRQLKARLIGAAVLVAIAVLLVPELLTGRKPSEQAPVDVKGQRSTRSVTIELGGSPGGVAQPAPERSPAPSVIGGPPAEDPVRRASSPERPAWESAPAKDAQAAVVAREAGSAPAPVTVEPETKPVPAPAPVTPPQAAPEPAIAAAATPDQGGWAVQVGAFGAPASARKLVQELESAGYRSYVTSVRRSGKELHRVRVGPAADRADAERLAAKLEERGLPAAVVAND